MKKIIFVLFLLCQLSVQSQEKKDSTWHYENKITMLLKETIKNLKESSTYKEAEGNLIRYNNKQNNYSSFIVYGSYHKHDLANLNKSIVASGFSTIDENALGVGIGWSTKRGKGIVDINVLHGNFTNSAKKTSPNQEIRVSSLDWFQTQVGYAIVNTKSIIIYPFVGFGLRSSQINLKNTSVVNAAGTNISNYIITPEMVEAKSFKVTYQAGLGIDFKISSSKNLEKTTFLFAKIGVNNTFGDEQFRIDNFKFNPNIMLNKLQISVGLKFAKRKTKSVDDISY